MVKHQGNHMLRRDKEWHRYFNPPTYKVPRCQLCEREYDERILKTVPEVYHDEDEFGHISNVECEKHGELERYQYEVVEV